MIDLNDNINLDRKYFFLTMTRLKVEGEVGSNFDEHESERS